MKLKRGSALLLTLFIVSGIIVVAFGGSYLIMAGLRSGNLQYDSSRAYYIAETGAEYSLMEVRKLSYDLWGATWGDIFSDNMPGYPGSYVVSYKTWAPIKLISVGTYGKTRRSVELEF